MAMSAVSKSLDFTHHDDDVGILAQKRLSAAAKVRPLFHSTLDLVDPRQVVPEGSSAVAILD